MSASSKKKQRSEESVAKLTEKQLAERKETRQLKIYTTVFVVVLALMLVAAIGFGITKGIRNSGILARSTTALTIDGTELNSAEMSYFYVDAVQNYLSTYGDYISMFGPDTSKPLNEQVFSQETGKTWADYFLELAQQQAVNVYALSNAAQAAGHTLSEAEKAEIDATISNLGLYGAYYGFSDAGQYIKAMYGNGADEASLRAYMERNALASSYSSAYSNSLTFTDEELADCDAEDPIQYNSYSYNSYYLPVSAFYEGGTANDSGVTTYSDEEKAAAAEKALETAQALTGESITSLEALDGAIASLAINAEAEEPVASTAFKNVLYSQVNSVIASWVTEEGRTEGDVTYIENSSTTTAEDGTETTTVNGYYVVYYLGMTDNNFPLANVRHILVSFQGGTADANGNTVYTDAEKAAAKLEAEDLLAQWQSGKASEETFAEMAKEHSTDPGSADNGGLYEGVYPGQMVAAFNDWCFDGRKPGDTGIVETNYGYHVMFYSGDNETTFRSYMLKNTLTNKAYDAWYQGLVEAANASMVPGKTTYLPMDMVINGR